MGTCQLNPSGILGYGRRKYMVKAAQLGEWTRLGCYGHILSNAVNNGLVTDRKIQPALAKCHHVSDVNLFLWYFSTKNDLYRGNNF